MAQLSLGSFVTVAAIVADGSAPAPIVADVEARLH